MCIRNDEAQMTNDETVSEFRFVIRISSFLRASSFVIRHFLCVWHNRVETVSSDEERVPSR